MTAAVQNPSQSLSNSNQQIFRRVTVLQYCMPFSSHFMRPPQLGRYLSIWKGKIWRAIWPFPKGSLPIAGQAGLWPLTSGVHPITAAGHLFQTYLPDNKSLTQFWGQRERDWWNGAIWALLCPVHIYRCPHCNAMVSLHAQEEKEHTAVLSGTCGVQNAVITNSGRPIYVTRPAASWWTPAYCLPLLPPSSHRSCPASALLLYNQPSRAQHLLF